MISANDKAQILHGTEMCKARICLITKITSLKNYQQEIFPKCDYKYLTSQHFEKRPLIGLHFLYWIVIIGFCCHLAFKPFVNLYHTASKLHDMKELKVALLMQLPAFKQIFFIMGTAFLLFLAIIILRRKCIEHKCKPIAKEFHAESQALAETLQKLYQELNNLEIKMANPDNCIIPPKYWDAGEKIEEYILNLRANSITEAINLYESEKRQDSNYISLPQCPYCGSTNLETTAQVVSNGSGSIIIGLLIFLFIPIIGWIIGIIILCSAGHTTTLDVTICSDCKKRL